MIESNLKFLKDMQFVLDNQAEFNINSILEFVNCNLCGSNDFDIRKNSNYESTQTAEEFAAVYSSSSESSLMDQLVKCKNCDLEYLNPRIKTELALMGYSQAVDSRHHEEDKYRIHSFKRALRKVESNFFDLTGKAGSIRILDVGCAGGAFLKAAKDLGYETVGLEPSKYLAELGQETYDVEIYQTSLDDFAFFKNEFDVVTFWDVLEHVPDPRKTIQITHDALNASGTLVLNLPMIDTFPARLMGLRWPFYLNVHTYYFSKDTINELLESSGFKIVSTKAYWQSLSLGYVLTRAGIKLPTLVKKALTLSVRYYLGQRTIVAKKSSSD